jgi:hypothetical protein
MVTLRCSANLLKRLGRSTDAESSTGRLGDWYARPIFTKPQHLVLITNATSLLCVVIPLAPIVKLQSRFVAAAAGRIRQIPVSDRLIEVELAALEQVHIGPATSRSVISTMNQFVYSLEAWLAERPPGDLDMLGLWLCDTPCSAISSVWPWLEAEAVVAGSVANGRRPLKYPSNVL